MDVTFTEWVVRTGRPIAWPRAEDGDAIMALGNTRPLEEVVRHATSEPVRRLVHDVGLSFADAPPGQRGRYDVAYLVDLAYTVVCTIQKRFLPTH